jgi:hypothetical protein
MCILITTRKTQTISTLPYYNFWTYDGLDVMVDQGYADIPIPGFDIIDAEGLLRLSNSHPEIATELVQLELAGAGLSLPLSDLNGDVLGLPGTPSGHDWRPVISLADDPVSLLPPPSPDSFFDVHFELNQGISLEPGQTLLIRWEFIMGDHPATALEEPQSGYFWFQHQVPLPPPIIKE